MVDNKQFFLDRGFKSVYFSLDFLQPKQNVERKPSHSSGEENSKQPENEEKIVEEKQEIQEDAVPDFAALEEFKFENDRHRVIVALLIADFFLFMMKHMKNNHLIQFVYISQLVVDANGVLVFLKFLNQDFAKVIDFSQNHLDQ